MMSAVNKSTFMDSHLTGQSMLAGDVVMLRHLVHTTEGIYTMYMYVQMHAQYLYDKRVSNIILKT